MKQADDDWGFSPQIDAKDYEMRQKRYVSPIRKHDCEKRGCMSRYAKDTHDFEEVWDDFQLSQRQREVIYMETVQSKGRHNRESRLVRQFVSTRDGSYILRLATSTSPATEQMGDINFETREECAEYYNYCISLFGFTEVGPIPESDWMGEGFFADLDELDGGFFDDLDEMSGAFFDDLDELEDGDIEDESGWDTDDDNDWL